MDIFESEHSDIAWNKWNFRLFETKCHALAIAYTLDLDKFESEHSDITWNKWNCRLFETKCHALALNYFRFGHIWVRTFRY